MNGAVRLRLAVTVGTIALIGCSPLSPPRSTAALETVLLKIRPDSEPLSSTDLSWSVAAVEGAVLTRQTFNALVKFVEQDLKRREASDSDRYEDQVVLGASAYDFERESIGSEIDGAWCSAVDASHSAGPRKPYAVVVDVEAVLVEVDASPALERRWRAVPGFEEAVERFSDLPITIIWMARRPVTDAPMLISRIARAGFATPVLNETFRPLDATSPTMDSVRRRVVERFCVVAAVGDDLGDFWDGFEDDPDKRIAQATTMKYNGWHAVRDHARLWGNGWFLVPKAEYTSIQTKEGY